MEVRYEDFLQQPKETLENIVNFLGFDLPADFMNQIPQLKTGNFNKWRTLYSPEEKAAIGPILQPLLLQLGYAKDDSWYRE